MLLMSVSARYASGRGPGAITPDGCAVELYELLPLGLAEAALIASVTPAGGNVLELGAGAGRVTHCLISEGLSVVAVDESADMLACISGAEIVHSTIEDLHLQRQFDVVVLGSHLVNVPSDDSARALLQTCARHVAPAGRVLVERRDPGWFDRVAPVRVEGDGIAYMLTDVSRPGHDLVTATITYTVDSRSWEQTFTTRRLDDDQLTALLSDAGLTFTGFEDEARTWAAAAPACR